MAMRMIAAIIACLLAGKAYAASISEIIIRGQGVVTVSIPGTVDGSVISPDVGTPVDVTGKVYFGPGVAATDGSGIFVCCGTESISKIEVSLAGVGGFTSVDEYNGSRVELRDGEVFQFFLGAPFTGAGGGGYMSDADFQYTAEIDPLCDETGYCLTSTLVLGSWSVSDIDVRTGAVPEPAAWVLMLAGFGLVGSRLRRWTPAGATAG